LTIVTVVALAKTFVQ